MALSYRPANALNQQAATPKKSDLSVDEELIQLKKELLESISEKLKSAGKYQEKLLDIFNETKQVSENIKKIAEAEKNVAAIVQGFRDNGVKASELANNLTPKITQISLLLANEKNALVKLQKNLKQIMDENKDSNVTARCEEMKQLIQTTLGNFKIVTEVYGKQRAVALSIGNAGAKAPENKPAVLQPCQ